MLAISSESAFFRFSLKCCESQLSLMEPGTTLLTLHVCDFYHLASSDLVTTCKDELSRVQYSRELGVTSRLQDPA